MIKSLADHKVTEYKLQWTHDKECRIYMKQLGKDDKQITRPGFSHIWCTKIILSSYRFKCEKQIKKAFRGDAENIFITLL